MTMPSSRIVSSADAANELRLTESMIRRLCRQELIQGAEKKGRDWWIPSPVVRLERPSSKKSLLS